MSAALAVGQLVEAAGALPAAIPSPPQHTWYVGPFPIRAYALAILAGIAVALWLTRRRWVQRGGEADDVLEIAFWAVPFGIVGGRLYHVFSTPDPYWGPNGDPVRALYVWEGGLGIWGAVALGAVGAYIGCRRQRVSFPAFADALAPGLLLAQAVGRLGNWFNQELFGAPTTLPWGLRVDDSVAAAAGYPPGTLFHPTFLYEMVWNIGAALLLIYLDRRFRLGHGRVFWLYVFVYTLGRVWIEMLRIDEAELRPRPPAERLDLDPGRRRCVDCVYRCRASPPRARGDGVPRRSGRGVHHGVRGAGRGVDRRHGHLDDRGLRRLGGVRAGRCRATRPRSLSIRHS